MKSILCVVLCILITNTFCASPLHRLVLDPLSVRKEPVAIKEHVCVIENLRSPFEHVSAAAVNDIQKYSSVANDTQCIIRESGILGIFNGPWAKTARGIFQDWLKKEGPIETKEAVEKGIGLIKAKIETLDSDEAKTTGAFAAVASGRRLLWGCFSADYVLAIKKKNNGVFFLSTAFPLKKEEVINFEEVEEFHCDLRAGDGLILSSSAMISLLHFMRREEISEKTVQEAHDVFRGLADRFVESDRAAAEIMEQGKKLVEKVEGAKTLYPPKTALMVARIKDRRNMFGSLEDE